MYLIVTLGNVMSRSHYCYLKRCILMFKRTNFIKQYSLYVVGSVLVTNKFALNSLFLRKSVGANQIYSEKQKLRKYRQNRLIKLEFLTF